MDLWLNGAAKVLHTETYYVPSPVWLPSKVGHTHKHKNNFPQISQKLQMISKWLTDLIGHAEYMREKIGQTASSNSSLCEALDKLNPEIAVSE